MSISWQHVCHSLVRLCECGAVMVASLSSQQRADWIWDLDVLGFWIDERDKICESLLFTVKTRKQREHVLRLLL